MEYQLIISPDFDLSPADIASAWNADAQARAAATAHLTPSPVKQFDPTLAFIITLASTVGVGVLTNAVYDVLKAALLKKMEDHAHPSAASTPVHTR